MKLSKKILSLGLALFISAGAFSGTSLAKQNMLIEFIDVGAGDAIYIESPNGDDILIDAGTGDNGRKIVDYLKKQEKNMDLEYVISTHPDADHVGGLKYIFQNMKVKKFYYPKDVSYSTATAKEVINLAKKESGCKMYDAKSGTKLSTSGATLEFVHSKTNYTGDNEDSIMTYVDYGNLEVLLTGDAEKGAEAAGKKYNVDILQAPHHGSSGSSSSSFIKKYDPENIVISTDGKKYGHPSAGALNRYINYDENINVYRTDRNGNIKIYANGSKWWVENSKSTSQKIPVTKPGKESTSSSGGSSSNTTSSKYVYVSSTNKYHKTATSCRMKNSKKMTLSNAKKSGAVPCKNCY
ncbi:MAG: MBL fold metallo-hydrolase [Terrisporobacter sp.]|uniref:ComEC/Rec2 family competence protein n=1 Tax=Terrisporobacter sp. TaxID=1965305 RepID=UPI002FC79F46